MNIDIEHAKQICCDYMRSAKIQRIDISAYTEIPTIATFVPGVTVKTPYIELYNKAHVFFIQKIKVVRPSIDADDEYMEERNCIDSTAVEYKALIEALKSHKKAVANGETNHPNVIHGSENSFEHIVEDAKDEKASSSAWVWWAIIFVIACVLMA